MRLFPVRLFPVCSWPLMLLLAAALAVAVASECPAGHPHHHPHYQHGAHPGVRLGRWSGYGWSMGYHAYDDCLPAGRPWITHHDAMRPPVVPYGAKPVVPPGYRPPPQWRDLIQDPLRNLQVPPAPRPVEAEELPPENVEEADLPAERPPGFRSLLPRRGE
jgi:hypothetical protein